MNLMLTWKIWVLIGVVINIGGLCLTAYSFFYYQSFIFHPLGLLGCGLIVISALMFRKGVKDKEKADGIALSQGK